MAFHDALSPEKKVANEPIVDPAGQTVGTVREFWSWAYSNTLDNTVRGVLAEYLVGLALGVVDRETRVEWDHCDLRSQEGILVEVKSSAYIQHWQQEKPSSVTFSISEATGWNASDNSYAQAPSRPAKVYVFCVHSWMDPETIDPLDTRQWDFYVASTDQINSAVGAQKSISLASLRDKVRPKQVHFGELPAAIRAAAVS